MPEQAKITEKDFWRFFNESGKNTPNDWMEEAGIDPGIMHAFGESSKKGFIECLLDTDLDEIDGEPGSTSFIAININSANIPDILERLEKFTFQLTCSAFRWGWDCHKEFRGERDGGS